MRTCCWIVVGLSIILPCCVFGNLLQNAGFEAGTGADVFDYWTRNNDVHRETWAARSDSYGAAMYGWTPDGYLYQDVSADGASNYTFNAYANKETGFSSSYTVEMKIEFLATDLTLLKVVTNNVSSAASTWTELSVSGISPAGTGIVRPVLSYHGSAGSGNAFLWDDASLTSSVAETSVNLLLSPDFEDEQNWSLVDEIHYEGWAAQAGTNGLAMYGWTTGGYAAQDVLYPGLSNYTFSIYGAKDAGFDLSALNVELKLEFYSDLAGTILIHATTNAIVSAASSWTEYTLVGTAPAATELVRPVIGFGGTASSGGFKWDNAQLSSTPNYFLTHYVSPSGSHLEPYTSWGTAATNIQAALNACSSGSVVKVTNGTYTIDAALYVRAGQILESLNGRDVIIDAGQSDRCVYLNSHAVLDGFTLLNGMQTSSVADCYGGGVYCDAGTVRNCIIYSNTCTTVQSNSLGGGVYCTEGSLIENCDISYNQASMGYCYGGGIYAEKGSIIRNCEINDNKVAPSTVYLYFGAAAKGGGVYMNGECTVEDCEVYNNAAYGAYGYYVASAGEGGGIFCLGTGTVSDCSVVSNTAFGGVGGDNSGGSAGGCGIWAGPDSLIERCSVRFNRGHGGYSGLGGAGNGYSGGIYCNDGQINNSEIIGNRISGGGGGTSGGQARGGGVYATYGTTLRNVTIVDNESIAGIGSSAGSSWGGGVFLNEDSSMINCILYYNSAVYDNNITVDGSGYYYTHCCIEDVTGGVGNISNEPSFRNMSLRDYRLDTDSACINVGDNPSVEGLLDLDGNTRIKRGIVDLGAYESGEYLYVAKNTTPVSPYTNWMVAATNVGDAVAVAEDGDYIFISNGTYHVGAQIWIGNALTLRGVNGAASTIIDGNDASRCFYINNDEAVLDGLTIANGYAGEEGGTSRGGGVFSSAGGQFLNCTFNGNRAGGGTAYGGGLYIVRDGIITNCIFSDNSAWGGIMMYYYGRPAYGGGLYSGAASIIQNTIFHNNNAYGAQGYHGSGWAGGAGAYIISNQMLAGCSFFDNHVRGGEAGGRSSGTSGRGGGLYIFQSTVADCMFAGNIAEGGASGSGGWGAAGPGVGGGLYTTESIVERCTVKSNIARGAWTTGYGGGSAGMGGGIYADNNAVLRNCLIVENSATGGCFYAIDGSRGGDALGGGLYCVTGTVENCTIAGNMSHYGPGLNGALDGEEKGGGVYARSPLINCIVYNNSASNDANAFVDANGSFTYCCITPDPGGTGNITSQPSFLNAGGGNWHLAYASACIDAGSDLSGSFTDDLEGAVRPIDGDMNGSALFDIGAYEYDPQSSDTDADMLSDYDEVIVYFCDPIVEDSDSDGMLDGAEVVAGTSPTNDASFFAMESGQAPDYSGAGFVLRWNSVSGRQYSVLRSDDLTGDFTEIESGINALPPMNVYTDATATAEGCYYYKVQVQ